jgi:hypothetical protein
VVQVPYLLTLEAISHSLFFGEVAVTVVPELRLRVVNSDAARVRDLGRMCEQFHVFLTDIKYYERVSIPEDVCLRLRVSVARCRVLFLS